MFSRTEALLVCKDEINLLVATLRSGDWACALTWSVKGGCRGPAGWSSPLSRDSSHPLQAEHDVTCLWQIRRFSYLKAYAGSLEQEK